MQRQRTSSPSLATVLAMSVPEVEQTALTRCLHPVTRTLTLIDDRYQHFIQRRVDALTGGTRQAQLRDLYGDADSMVISEWDKQINRRIARVSGIIVMAAMANFYAPLYMLTALLATYELITYARNTYPQLLKEFRLKAEHLEILFFAGLWSTGYFLVGGLNLLPFIVIRKITLQTQDRTRKGLVNILGEQPRKVWVLLDETEVEIPFEQLQEGDILVLQAGQMIPVDGVITKGEAAVDQHRLTGESQPVEKSVGDPVLAATIILSGRVHISVEKAGKETLAAQIGDVLANTLDYHFSIEEQGKTIADSWVKPSLLATGLAGISLGLKSAVAVLSSAPGLDMMILGPMTLLNYLNIASRNRILIKDGRSLELLQKVDTVIFDKTGTLTLEQPQIKTIHCCVNMDAETILAYAAAAEQRQGHPIAKAILAAAKEQELTLPPISDICYELGYGLRVRLQESPQVSHHHHVCHENVHDSYNAAIIHQHSPDAFASIEEKIATHGCLIRVGSERFMAMESIPVPPAIMTIQDASHALGHSLVLVAVEETLVGAIELQPTIRPEAQEIVGALQARNLEIAIISGDQTAPTQTLAHRLGIERYFANVLPEEKAALVESLQTEGKTVCFVGDGINDAIALKKAEVSISLRGATTIATDTAQIVLMDETLQTLPKLFDLAHELRRNLMTSLLMVTGPSCLVIGGVFFCHVGVPLAVTAYSATFAAGVANAMSPLFRHRLIGRREEQTAGVTAAN
ncbi:MAG: heavy metal translocating P-type ATPase [Caldilineaceae bacterium]